MALKLNIDAPEEVKKTPEVPMMTLRLKENTYIFGAFHAAGETFKHPKPIGDELLATTQLYEAI